MESLYVETNDGKHKFYYCGQTRTVHTLVDERPIYIMERTAVASLMQTVDELRKEVAAQKALREYQRREIEMAILKLGMGARQR